MARLLLEDALDAVAPKRRSSVAKRKIVTGVQVAAGMLSALALKKPGMINLQRLLAALLMPSGNDTPDRARTVLSKIRKLKAQLDTGLPEEQEKKLRHQLEALFELLTEDEE